MPARPTSSGPDRPVAITAPSRPALLTAADGDAVSRAAGLLGSAVLRVDGAGRVVDLNGPAAILVGDAAAVVGRDAERVLGDHLWRGADSLDTADGGRLVLLRDGTALQEAETARDASERLARALLVTIPDIVYLFDIAAGRNMWFNREVAEVTGYTASEMRAMGRGVNGLVHPDDLARWPAFVAERDALPDGAFAAFEYRVRHRDGRWRWLSARETVFARDADGRPTQAFGVAQDVTAQKEAERTLAERAEHQGRIAEALQRPLLQALASNETGLRVHTVYRPASDEALVGGDFFDVVDLGAGRTALVVGDVMGKGLQAAAHTAQAKFMLRTLLLEGHAPPAALARLNGYLYASGPGVASEPETPPFVAAAVAVVDVEAGAVQFAVAGAEPPLVARLDGSGGAVEPVACGGLPLGVLPDWEQDGPDVVALGPGDLVALYTDGITEARNAAGDLFGVGRMRSALGGACRLPPDAVGAALVDRIRAWTDGVRHDDTCLLVAQVAHPAPAPRSSYVVRHG
ncbi:PP2C family protein-serine/threonine phosphatase [Rubrivirga litoralis]|uniref:SpoIIE family protein phosphatase n=1 Tax=Rubrivirga litoralis TaxID=3075598 RepID=A0ABU3BMR4_9BACT|nr:SpoIIE family protein phosphatase [Rubrivirga sp. F394]MDT0630584.1 SpoIIE family protein phosphatase [Rubrivirga sp. F394]